MKLTREQVCQRLFEVASKSPCAKRQVGCIIAVHDGPYIEDGLPTQYQILGEGFNYNPSGGPCEIGVNEVTHKLITDPDVIHAEVAAIDDYEANTESLPWTYNKDKEVEVFVTYEPCQNCREYAKSKGFNKFTLVKEKDMGEPQPSKEPFHGTRTDHAAMLAERGSRYGTFADHAAICQALKDVMHATPGWQRLTPDQKEALEMNAHKTARILNGDPNYKDSWDDIIGYTKLVADRL